MYSYAKQEKIMWISDVSYMFSFSSCDVMLLSTEVTLLKSVSGAFYSSVQKEVVPLYFQTKNKAATLVSGLSITYIFIHPWFASLDLSLTLLCML